MNLSFYGKLGKIKALCFVFLIPMSIFILLFLFLTGRFKDSRGDFMLFSDEGSIHNVIFLDKDGNELVTYEVEDGGNVPEVPEYSPEGYIFAGWNFPTYAGLQPEEFPVYEDMRIEPVLYDQNLIVLNGLGIAGKEAVEVDITALDALIESVEKEIDDEGRR